jgi:hypothetical protein
VVALPEYEAPPSRRLPIAVIIIAIVVAAVAVFAIGFL